MRNFIFIGLIYWGNILSAQQPILVKDIYPGMEGSTQYSFGSFSLDTFYFFQVGDNNNKQYWVTDGTNDGTKLLKQIVPENIPVTQVPLFNFDHVAYFYSTDDEMGNGSLWRTDGTTDGTYKFMEYCGAGCRVVDNNAVLNDKLLFTGTDVNGDELWISDGTINNTILLKDINPGPGDGKPTGYYNFKGKIYFSASSNGTNRELWRTDGTTTGTELFIDLDGNEMTESAPQILAVSGDIMYFSAVGSIAAGRELWKTDGTIPGTTLVKDINTGEGSGFITPSNNLLRYFNKVVNNKLIFFANTVEFGREWWVSNGFPEGTHLLKDIVPDPLGVSSSLMLFSNDSFALFQVNDGIHGRELWRTDGTESGTLLLKDIFEGPDHGLLSSTGLFYIQHGNKLYFVASDSTYRSEIWVSDGTLGGTKRLTDMSYEIFGGESPKNLLQMAGDYLYFTAPTDEYGSEVWKLLIDAPSNTQESPDGLIISFAVYPNPNHGQFLISGNASVPSDVQVALFDMQGKLIVSQKFNQLSGAFVREVNVAEAPAGLYLLSLQTETGIQTKLISIINH
jgi:ELWxxDGT repeat protein